MWSLLRAGCSLLWSPPLDRVLSATHACRKHTSDQMYDSTDMWSKAGRPCNYQDHPVARAVVGDDPPVRRTVLRFRLDMVFEPHPSSEELEAYPEIVEEHLLICERCQNELALTDQYIRAMKSAGKNWSERAERRVHPSELCRFQDCAL
jgi:hypothetical protein